MTDLRRDCRIFRRSVAFPLVLATTLSACGHQVTPIPAGADSDLAGDIVVKFTTSAALDFATYTYVVAIDTCGPGVPYPDAFATTYTSYSFAFLIGGGQAGTAQPVLIQYYLNPASSGLTKLANIPLNPSVVDLVDPYESSNEFELIFPRRLLNDPYHLSSPCPNPAVPSPAQTPSDATGVDSPPYLTTWTFNFMIFEGTTPADSLGPGGPADQTFPGIVVHTNELQTLPLSPEPPSGALPAPAADITYAEVDSYPL